jgi:hypothetical protein
MSLLFFKFIKKRINRESTQFKLSQPFKYNKHLDINEVLMNPLYMNMTKPQKLETV